MPVDDEGHCFWKFRWRRRLTELFESPCLPASLRFADSDYRILGIVFEDTILALALYRRVFLCRLLSRFMWIAVKLIF
ncbi:hypothetical protein XM38_025610 [Halomicronema hongdechloris C2206]|uniref:Uncharacterized protein n=1 Tax=Halomicronema hongdechloris C2206 TaxID=1641165 RepID=A0A1Z3HMT0_9CYAN|nr:hypothetical protein XM38_025610 [Halomicronema hongdechloris C2206]